MLTQGTVIHAGYRVLERIGQGEIGEVYRAERLAVDQLCVLKVLNAGLMSDSLLVERFKEEAERASLFQHPNGVRIEEVGEAEDGRPFVVMEYLPGKNLWEVIAREGRLPVARACFITRQVATVLEAVHALGVVHQDVKPGNIMLVETPAGMRVCLLDCCISRIKEDRRRDMGRVALRGHGVLMGAPEYFSPEMVVGKRGSELDGRSDLYSLGVLLYQMLCGESPFEVKSGAMDALLAHLLIPPKPINELYRDVPEELGRLVMRMLEKKPESRPASSRVVVEELEKVEGLLCQTSSAARAIATPRDEEAVLGALPSVASTSILPSPSQSADTASAIQPDKAEPEASVPQPPFPVVHPPLAATQETPRRWLRWAAGTAITAIALGLVAWFLAPLRSKLPPYFQPGASSTNPTSGRSSGEATDRTGQTGQSATIPASRLKAPPATTPPGTTAFSEEAPQPTGEKPGASAPQDENTVGKQAAPPVRRTSDANPAAPRPNPDPAIVQALATEGDGFLRRGEYDRAVQSYLKALRLDPSSEALQTKILRARTAKAAEEKYLSQ
jgi:serine/threonine protein kinase